MGKYISQGGGKMKYRAVITKPAVGFLTGNMQNGCPAGGSAARNRLAQYDALLSQKVETLSFERSQTV